MPESDALLKFIRETLLAGKDVEITPDTRLFADKLIDSMNILYLIGYVESRLGRRLSDDEIVMSNFRSARAIGDAFFAKEEIA